MSAQAYSPPSMTGLALAALLAFVTSTASAMVLYEQPPVDGGNGFYAASSVGQQAADDFTLGGAVNLESITWWGGYDGNVEPVPNDDNFLVRLYSDVSGTGTVLQEFSSVTFSRTGTLFFDGAGDAIYRYNFDLTASLVLSSGTYYLFVQNLGTSDWLWLEGSSGNGGLWYRGVDSDEWSSEEGDLALRLEGTQVQVVQIPEPSSLALFGIAGVSMVLAGRRRERQVA